MRSTRTVKTRGAAPRRAAGRPARAPVKTPARSGAAEKRARDRARSKRRALRAGAGGRPLAFLPALVLAYAIDLRLRGRGWRAIVEELQRSGNGRYDVRTLTRRIVQVLAGQNSAELAAAAAAGDVAGGAVKTRRGLAGAARPGRRLQRRSKPTPSRKRAADLVGVSCPVCRRTILAGEVKHIGTSGYAFHQPPGRAGHTFDPTPATAGGPTCRRCGCSEDHACMTTELGGPCFWVEPDLCSACAPALARRLLDHPSLEA